jgi:hypothetical protein
MRPTNLGFRSPKERTAEFNIPSVTFDGRHLPYLQATYNQTIGKSKRFTQYDTIAKRTSTSVGPGSYDLRSEPIKQWSIAGTPVIKPYVAIKDPSANGYYFIGNHMVYDPNFARLTRRSIKESSISELKPVRTASISTPRARRNLPSESNHS